MADEIALNKNENNGLDFSQFFEVTALNFPRPILLTQIQIDDILQLQLHPQEDKNVVLVLYQGQVAGYIPLTAHPILIESMRAGNDFDAIVREIYGGHCRVRLRPRR